MAETERRAASSHPNARDFVAGASSGGFLVFCAQHFIQDSALSRAVELVCPTISILVVNFSRRVSAWMKRQSVYYADEFDRQRLLKRTEAELLRQRDLVERIENDPHASPAHRAKVRAVLEDLEVAVSDLRKKGIVTVS